MAREWTVASGLQQTSFPVPRPVVADLQGEVLGVPFTVVEYVPGRVVRWARDLEELTDSEVECNARALVSLMVDLHAVDFDAVGLGGFGRPEGFTARQVQLWTRQWERVRSRDLADVDRLARVLAERVPASSRASIVHGDLRVDNTILDADDPALVLAVVDWEMSTLGDPLTDLALLCAYRDPNFDTVLGESAAWTSPRYPKADELAQWYATLSGQDLADWDFYLGLAFFKLGVIGEGIAHRARLGAAPDPSALAAGDATPSFIAAGLRALGGAH
jgi:aminoglycoside phosphotransferase (APT) family kinase protein